MNNIEELREHCKEMMAVSRMPYAYIPASSIITLIDRIEKAEAALSAANEKLSKPVSIWKLNNFREAPAGGIEWAKGYVIANNRAVKAIRDADFTVEE
ncbi:hypothetical protein [Yersinia rochesterensis]|uniref:hypothetical protein n=1 Tax=Yersinia rochesterensis TaxID=1604335 RepID=UPI0011A9D8BE|nr:hypothetical protein [Yersinia rochesterensis]